MESFFSRLGKAGRYVISGITPATWMGPLQPIQPYSPELAPRQYDYSVGRNIFYTPRGEEKISFNQLRNLAVNSELVRQAIETRLDEMDALEWKIIPKEDSNTDEKDPNIKILTKFFEKPDRVNDWSAWQRLILEEMYVIDALSIVPRMNRGGGLYSLESIDGSTIFPLIDADGRRPLEGPAYQQILKGIPKADYAIDELIYAVRKVRVNSVYGYSAVEQIIKSAQTDIERVKSQLAFFTQGTIPDAYMEAPDGMTPDNIKAYEDNLITMLGGNLEARRGIPVVPHGMKLNQLKEPQLKSDWDEWMWRKIALAFRLPPTPMIKQMNRSTAESDKDRAQEQGLTPTMLFVKRLVNRIIIDYFEIDNLEFTFISDREEDPVDAATIDTEYVKSGIMTINEVRQAKGLPDVEGGDVPMLATATGYVPIDGSAPLNAPDEEIQPPIGTSQGKDDNQESASKLKVAKKIKKKFDTQYSSTQQKHLH